jgi:NAD(P)-dependent dehydrogenase (short-subunit alcohol dehydrogenase family)
VATRTADGIRTGKLRAIFIATNAAIIALAKAFAEQGIKDGVQVNSVSPGAVMNEPAAIIF